MKTLIYTNYLTKFDNKSTIIMTTLSQFTVKYQDGLKKNSYTVS